MNLYATRECDCRASIPRGAKRPERCVEHGNPYLTQKALEASRKPRPRINPISEKRQREIDEGERPRTGSTLKRTEPKRDWIDARAKVDHQGCCRICKRTDLTLEAAHVLGREHAEPKARLQGKRGQPPGGRKSEGSGVTWRLHAGDPLEQLRLFADESVHCCVTSPPSWGLRDY